VPAVICADRGNCFFIHVRPANRIFHHDDSSFVALDKCTFATTGPTVANGMQGTSYMIRKLKTGKYRLYAKKRDPQTDKRRNLGTFSTREAAERHEREIHFFKKSH
jgi:hypothetical protein